MGCFGSWKWFTLRSDHPCLGFVLGTSNWTKINHDLALVSVGWQFPVLPCDSPILHILFWNHDQPSTSWMIIFIILLIMIIFKARLVSYITSILYFHSAESHVGVYELQVQWSEISFQYVVNSEIQTMIIHPLLLTLPIWPICWLNKQLEVVCRDGLLLLAFVAGRRQVRCWWPCLFLSSSMGCALARVKCQGTGGVGGRAMGILGNYGL